MNLYSRPMLHDWLLLAVNLIFVLSGLLMLPREPAMAIPCVAFFGAGGALAISNIVRKRRFSRFDALRVEVIGGAPIRPSKAYALLLGFTLTGLGFLPLIFMPPPPILAVEAVIALAGVILLVGVLSGRLPVGFLRFDPEGLFFCTREGSYQFPWDCIVAVMPGELHDNPVLFLHLRSLSDAVAFPPMSPQKLRARLESNLRWAGAHEMIMTAQYRIDLPVLTAAVERYVTLPDVRSELIWRALLE